MAEKLFERVGNQEEWTSNGRKSQPDAAPHWAQEPCNTEPYRQLVNGMEEIKQSLAQVRAFQGNAAAKSSCVTETIRKERRKVIRRDIVVDAQGSICLAETYDDNSRPTLSLLMLNVRGTWNVYKLKFLKTTSAEERYAIVFPETGLWVVGKCKKISKTGLYDAFIRAGVQFCAMREEYIKTVLFQEFSSKINFCNNCWEVPELAGFNDGKFLDATSVGFAWREDFPKLPIATKVFRFVKEPATKCVPWFDAVRNIAGWRERVIILAAPLMGLLSSTMAKAGMKCGKGINFVLLDPLSRTSLIKLIQIFNRDQTAMIAASLCDNKIADKLSEINDEVLMVDAVLSEDTAQYDRKKCIKNTGRIARKILETGNPLFDIQREINALPVFFSTERMLGNSVFNVFVDLNFFKKPEEVAEALRGECVEAVLTLFVRYVERHYEEVCSYFCQLKALADGQNCAAWTAIWEICKKFWTEYGIDICDVMNVRADINWSWLLNDRYDSEEMRNLFVQSVRKNIGKYLLIEKKRGCEAEGYFCVFDKDYLWIRPQILENILELGGLKALRLRILCELRATGDLKTDAAGLTRRLQIGKKRMEFHQFSRELFNVLGEPDIEDLGGQNNA